MERFKWLAKKHWWKPIPIAVGVYFAVQWLLSGSPTGTQTIGLSELQDKVNHSQVKQATFHAADHELKVTLTDGVTRTAVYPVEYDDELAALLLSKSAAVMAENPNFFQENKGIFLFVGGVLLITIVPMVAFGVKSRFIARSKRVSDVPAERFSDVLGADEQIAELAQLTDYIRNPDKYEQAGVRMPRGWLFTGPPGTGKTLLARALAGEANVPLYAYSGSDFAASFVGEGATRVKEMFKAARNAAFDQVVIILIDEIDAVGANRHDSSHESSVEILNQLLVELDGFLSAGRVVVIGATNRKDVLDPALLRPGRLSRHLFMPEPGLPVRVAMLEMYAGKLTHLAPDISFVRLAKRTVGMSGAEIAEICNSAGLRAVREHMRWPPGHHRIAPSGRQRRLLGRGETHHILVVDQPLGPNIEQPVPAVTEDHQKIGYVLPPAVGGVETQPERLWQHVHRVTHEIHRHEQPLFLQRLKTVMAAGRHQELQPRPVTLPGAPGESADRQRPQRRHRFQIPCRTGQVAAGEPPQHRPSPRPVRQQHQPVPGCPIDRVGGEQLIHGAAIRPSAASSPTRTTSAQHHNPIRPSRHPAPSARGFPRMNSRWPRPRKT